jgi:hypothetical protein
MKRNSILKLCFSLGIGIIIGVIFSNSTTIISHIKQAIGNIIIEQWPPNFTLAEIQCSYDNQIQKAYFYSSSQNQKTPLIVSLHSWSGDYKQYDPLAELVKKEDWNYIHPDFRGANDSPDACMSEAVIQDIDDAIKYAIENGKIDEGKIIVVGASGGGMAVMGMYLRSSYNLYYCMAWAAISDLEAWYFQSKYADDIYSKNILQSTDSGNTLDIGEARRRSPLFISPLEKKLGMIEIYAGINDGYTGSVSILHSLLFYNKISSFCGLTDVLVSDQDIIMLLSRSIKDNGGEYIDKRRILYKKSSKNIGLFIFDGTHEILTNYAFNRIMAIVSKQGVIQ